MNDKENTMSNCPEGKYCQISRYLESKIEHYYRLYSKEKEINDQLRQTIKKELAKSKKIGDSIEKRIIMWLLTGERGVSSNTICYVLSGTWKWGMPVRGALGLGDIPCDPSDFYRCHMLLEVIPEWRERLHEVGEVFPRWKPIIKQWDELTRLYEIEKNDTSAPLLYDQLYKLNNIPADVTSGNVTSDNGLYYR